MISTTDWMTLIDPDWMTLIDKDENLLPELEAYVSEGPLGPMVHHPLLIDMTYRKGKAALVNHTYHFKKALTEKRLADKDWAGYIYVHERPYRLEAFNDILTKVGDRKYWPLLRDVWDDSENIYQHLDTWRELWEFGPEDIRGLAMTKQERTFLSGQPQTIEIWRGSRVKAGILGMSWTINRDKAVWFANRWQGEGHVTHGTVDKADVLAYLDGRNESEIVAFPEFVDVA